ncbi:MAG: tetratricopeptide repeat protein, partial [Saprospiraceae bacterium]
MLSAEMGDFPKALEYAFSSIKEFEQMNRKESMCYSYGFISNIYSSMGNTEETEKYLKKSIAIAEELDLKVALGEMLGSLCEIYLKKNQHELAKESIDKSIQIAQEIGNNRGLMNGYQVLGSIYSASNALDSALYYYKLSLDLNKKIGDQQFEANVSLKVGEVYRIKKDFNNAKMYFLKAENIAKNNNYTNLIIDTNKGLYEVSKNIGSPKEAYRYIEDHIAMKDSVYNKENDEKIAEQKVQYEYDKKSAIDKLVYDQNIAQQKTFQKYLALGLLLLSGLLFFAFRAYRIKKKTAETISNQKDEI